MGEVQIDGGADLPQPTAFGREMRKLFLFDDKYVNLNHGSFGAFPRSIRDLVQRYQAQTESRPDPFLRYDYPKLLDRSRESLSKFLHAPLDEVVLLSNATTGVNTVLRSLVFQPGDHILYFNTTYGACAKTVEYVCEYTPAKPIRLDLSLPIEDDAIVGMMREAIRAVKEEGGRVKVAILDTVVSMPGVKMPLESMVKVCKDEDVLSLVDGAHGIGHLELDLAKLDADFFISNCHKWLFVPRGCAVFHVPLRNQPLIRSSLPTSHGWHPMPSHSPAGPKFEVLHQEPGKSDFVYEFQFIGTMDNSSYLCIPDAIAFREEVCGGEQKIRKYCHELAREGGKLVANALGTEVMENESGTLMECNFTNVRLPLKVISSTSSSSSSSTPPTGEETFVGAIEEKHQNGVVGWMQQKLNEEYDTFIAILFHNGNWWARLSAQIYLDLSDFEYGARVLKEACERAGQGEFLGRVDKLERGEATMEQDPS